MDGRLRPSRGQLDARLLQVATLDTDRADIGCVVGGEVMAQGIHSLINRTIRNTIRNTLNNPMRKRTMSSLTANDLKTKGIAAIEAVLAERPEAIVTVRGKDRFVVIDIAQYHHLRECELEAALAETRADVAAGRYVKESAAAHVKRVKKSAA